MRPWCGKGARFADGPGGRGYPKGVTGDAVSGERLDLRGEPALVARGLVLMDDFLVGDAVEDADGLAIDFLRLGLLARLDRRADTLDRAAQRGTQADVVETARL